MDTKYALTRTQLGAVYTTDLLAAWAADILLAMLKTKRPVVLDPACGDGSLLHALSTRGMTRLVGVDCDERALTQASVRVPSSSYYKQDGLVFLADASAEHTSAFEGIIANPPWGAKVGLTREELRCLGYRVLSGQTDSWDLFVDGILRAAKPHAPIVLILPDALFLPEHRPIRELLATESRIELIARLGEGFFPEVCRGVVVVAVRKAPPRPMSRVLCVRLSPEARRNVLTGVQTFAHVTRELGHRILQSRFLTDLQCRFDIDTREHEHARLVTLEREQFPWDGWLEGGRGIELSKSGRIVHCPHCGSARPLPRTSRTSCQSCLHEWLVDSSAIESIIRIREDDAKTVDWHPLIVGEDVDRHACIPSRLIRVGVSGIRYKSLSSFARPKLLIRKTGVGIKAVVDESGAATNQVVFHFTRRKDSPSFVLDYMEGVLCSRVLLAWHLKRHGEVEWRSHPYITQHVIRGFPVPVPNSPEEWAQAQAIANAVQDRRMAKRHDSAEDIAVERLVAGLFGLTEADMRWVLGVLDSAQQLEPIRTLRLPSASLVAPLCVSNGAP